MSSRSSFLAPPLLSLVPVLPFQFTQKYQHEMAGNELSITKVLFRDFGCKIQTKPAAFQKTANSVKYENVIIDAIKRSMSDLELSKGNTMGRKQGACKALL